MQDGMKKTDAEFDAIRGEEWFRAVVKDLSENRENPT